VNLKLSLKQLALLTTLAEDQLFRREFIEPKMPGQRLNVEELQLGKDIVVRLRALQVAAPEKRLGTTVRRLHAV
jgi:hypothetical protein